MLPVFQPSTDRNTRVSHPSRSAWPNSDGFGTTTGRLRIGLDSPELDGLESDDMADQQ
jgi:hypothetical protein